MRAVVDTVTPEEYVRQIRSALVRGDRASADHHFVTLLQRSRNSADRWVRRVIAMTPALHHHPSASAVSDDLRQDLALYLWERIATRHDLAWEHTYWRALLWAEKHVATRYMRTAGYWVDKRALLQGRRGVASLVTAPDLMEEIEAPDVLSAAEVAGDVRSVVMRLPPAERAAVVLRYWGGMGERDIGRALGCTDRTVRTLLQQARGRLGVWYEGRVWSPPTIE